MTFKPQNFFFFILYVLKKKPFFKYLLNRIYEGCHSAQGPFVTETTIYGGTITITCPADHVISVHNTTAQERKLFY